MPVDLDFSEVRLPRRTLGLYLVKYVAVRDACDLVSCLMGFL